MLRFRFTERGGLRLSFEVDAETCAIATIIAQAFVYTHGRKTFDFATTCLYGSPTGAKTGVVTLQKPTPAYLPEVDYAGSEQRILANMDASTFYQYNPEYKAQRAEYMDGHGWINIYPYEGYAKGGDGERKLFPKTGSIVYKSKKDAQHVADHNGKGERNVPTLISWPVEKQPAKEARRKVAWNYDYPTAEEKLQKAALEYAAAGSKAHELSKTYGVSSIPTHYHHLTHSEQQHFCNRLRAWTGISTIDDRAKLHIHSSDDADYLLISAGSSQWRACMSRLKAWLSEQSVAFSAHNTSMVKVRWLELAPFLWPL